MKKVIQSLCCLFLLTISVSHAQSNNDTEGMSIDKQLVFVLKSSNINEIQSTYTVDISSLQFKSSTELNQLCELFSFDFHQLKGDFTSKEIVVTLDKKSLIDRKFTITSVNDHFSSISGRMLYSYNLLNKN